MRKLLALILVAAGVLLFMDPAMASTHKVTGTVIDKLVLGDNRNPCPNSETSLLNAKTADQLSAAAAACATESQQNGYVPRTNTGAACWGAVILQREQVVIKDDRGRTLAATSLRAGVSDADGTHCLFKFSVKLADAKFYSIKIGQHPSVTYSASALRRSRWHIALAS